MRISTNSIYDTAATQLGSLQTGMSRTQLQLSTNRRILTPGDDPVAAARALEVTQSQSMNEQFLTNRRSANASLALEDVVLGGTDQLIQDMQTLVVEAGNGAYSAADRLSLATKLEGQMNDLLGLANAKDSFGGYLFAGFKSDTQPFTLNKTGATYQGDTGQRQLQVAAARDIPTSDSGFSVFENNLTGNGTFVTAADPNNLARGGSGVISTGSVTDPTKVTGHQYQVDFSVQAGVGTYTVTDLTLAAEAAAAVPPLPVPDPVVPATPYTAGAAIAFDGMQFDISGMPLNGDAFTVAPSTPRSLFTTVRSLLDQLRAPGDGAAGQASLKNGLNDALNSLSTAHDNVLTVRAEVGSRMKELDYLDTAGDDLDIQYTSALSALQDLDTVKAMSLFTQQKITLEASQRSFTALSGLSLFNYIN